MEFSEQKENCTGRRLGISEGKTAIRAAGRGVDAVGCHLPVRFPHPLLWLKHMSGLRCGTVGAEGTPKTITVEMWASKGWQ